MNVRETNRKDGYRNGILTQCIARKKHFFYSFVLQVSTRQTCSTATLPAKNWGCGFVDFYLCNWVNYSSTRILNLIQQQLWEFLQSNSQFDFLCFCWFASVSRALAVHIFTIPESCLAAQDVCWTGVISDWKHEVYVRAVSAPEATTPSLPALF